MVIVCAQKGPHAEELEEAAVTHKPNQQATGVPRHLVPLVWARSMLQRCNETSWPNLSLSFPTACPRSSTNTNPQSHVWLQKSNIHCVNIIVIKCINIPELYIAVLSAFSSILGKLLYTMEKKIKRMILLKMQREESDIP